MSSRSYFTRYVENVPSFKVRHDFFKNSFFPSTVIEWNKIYKNIRKSESLNIFKKSNLEFIRPFQNRVYNCHNPKGIKLLTRLRVGLSHVVNRSLGTVFRILLIRYAIAAKILKAHLITFFTVWTFYMKEKTLLKTVSCIVPNIF